MANRIFTNGEEGKILTSVGNRIIKQPYEFGNAFQNRMGLNNYIVVNGLNITPYAHFINWYLLGAYESNVNYPLWYYFSQDGNNFSSFFYSLGSGYRKFLKNNDVIMSSYSSFPVSYQTTTHLNDLIYNSENLLTYRESINSFSYSVSVPSVTNNSNISKIVIGAGKNTVGDGAPNIFPRSAQKYNGFAVFSRIVSLSELQYYFNNRSGSNFQSKVGLEVYIYCDKAEILDFSLLQDGSDMRVGCRDYSGFNRHGEIMNLPAGTLQQKVDYANANLFVPFI